MDTTTTLTAEDRNKIIAAFGDMRKSLQKFMDDRDFKMSNPQIFTFLLYAPVCLAIASDRQVDEKEIRLLSKITENIDVNKTVNIDLLELIALAPEPSDIMLNEEFNMRVDAELLYLSRNIDKYENDIINAVKAMLTLDSNPEAETSLTSTFNQWFDFIVKNNAGRDKDAELAKVNEYKKKIGLA